MQVPALLKEENDEKFFERMELVETLEAIVADLLGTFLELRTSEHWETDSVPKLRGWLAPAA